MRHTLYKQEPKYVRDTLNQARETADLIHQLEQKLIIQLREIDQKRLYVRYGFNSLMGFCRVGLKFSKLQSQRLATLVRRPSE